MTRYKASLIHLLGSVFVLLLVFLLISRVWYPGVLFSKSAGVPLLKIIVAVDVIVGPFITLIIFDIKKKLLKLDLAIILILQIGFICYGMWTVYASRPVFIVFTGNVFHMVRANEIEKKDLSKVGTAQFKHMPILGPEFVGTREPEDLSVRNDIAFAGLSGMGIQNLPQFYVPYSDVRKQVIAAAKNSQQWKKIDAEHKTMLESYEKSHPGLPVSFLFLSYKTFILFVAVNTQTGDIIEII
ncbi:hypothetical protein AAKU58_000224 [Oxalobacteraceae bacterium GrIS 1.18]